MAAHVAGAGERMGREFPLQRLAEAAEYTYGRRYRALVLPGELTRRGTACGERMQSLWRRCGDSKR